MTAPWNQSPYWHSRSRVANYEVAHAILALSVGFDVKKIKIIRTGRSSSFRGFVLAALPAPGTWGAAEELLNMARVLLAEPVADFLVNHIMPVRCEVHPELLAACRLIHLAAQKLGVDCRALGRQVLADTVIVLTANKDPLYFLAFELQHSHHHAVAGWRVQGFLKDVRPLAEIRREYRASYERLLSMLGAPADKQETVQ